eukprot:scaffold147306_cov20-Prasinocladus_malaysianus.AAC.1
MPYRYGGTFYVPSAHSYGRDAQPSGRARLGPGGEHSLSPVRKASHKRRSIFHSDLYVDRADDAVPTHCSASLRVSANE